MELTTWTERGEEHEAVFCSWADAEEILGHTHDGTSDDDEAIVNAADRQFPKIYWLSIADGGTDEFGLYYFNPYPIDEAELERRES